MKFSEALLLLEQGKKIRRSWWVTGSYYYFSNQRFLNNNGDDAYISRDALIATDWEEYVEPNKKRIVKMWPAIIKSDGHFYIPSRLYEDESSAKKYHGEGFIRLATEYPCLGIEVEDT